MVSLGATVAREQPGGDPKKPAPDTAKRSADVTIAESAPAPKRPSSRKSFVPRERISADTAVAFPVDI